MNRVILIGNLTKDVEVRSTPSGVTVANFTIAVNRRFKDASGEKKTEYFTCIAWRQLGEMCGKYLARGKKVCVVGELQTRSYEAKDGTKRYITEIVADEVEFLTPKTERSDVNGFTQDEFGTEVDDELPF